MLLVRKYGRDIQTRLFPHYRHTFLSRLHLVFIAFVCLSFANAQSYSPLQLKETILLPGIHGRIDHMDVDLEGRRVFVAGLGNSTVGVAALDSNGAVQMLAGFDEPQGILFLPAYRAVYVASGGNSTVDILDATDLKPAGTISGLHDADNIRYDPRLKRVIVGYGGGGLAVIDPATRLLDHTIPLRAHPESFQIDCVARRLFVNVPDNGDIEVIDQDTRTVVMKWKTRPARENFPMALDTVSHRLFGGFRDPASAEVFDTRTGALLSSTPIHDDVDDLFLDERGKRVFASCGEGYVDILSRIGINQLKHTNSVRTRRGARTSFMIPSLNLFVVALPEFGEKPAELRIYSVH